MKIPSANIPQADKLSEVVQLVEAVANGASTFQDLASRINKVERQGRYYRRAAEIIGFISNSQNHSELTPLGRELIETSPLQRHAALLKAVLNTSIFQRLLPYFERHSEGVSRTALQRFITAVADLGGESMAPRRMSTIISWLESLNIVRKLPNGNLVLESKTFAQTAPVDYAIAEPLLPKAKDLTEYKIVFDRTSEAARTISVLRDQAELERANKEHRKLVNLVAERIRQAGAIPKSNQLVDLAVFVDRRSFIFEMKSTTEGNVRSQIRTGLSQLYEYRYLQNLSDATLVLVVSNVLSNTEAWMHDYLEKDRQIRLIWDGHDQLFGSRETREELAFLW